MSTKKNKFIPSENQNIIYLQIGTLYQSRGWDGVGDGREVQKGGDLCIPMADLC